jgi:hypothetical protein
MTAPAMAARVSRAAPMHAAHLAPFKSNGGCLLYEIHY